LWSTVNNHDFQPVDATGRFSAPSDVLGVATAATSLADAGRSILVMILPNYFSVNR
jgi:hypothetical protein